MNKIHFKLILVLALLIQGCAIDEHSYIVRLWSDGFVYTKKEGEANEYCSNVSNKVYPSRENDDEWFKIYRNCMKEKGYRY